MNYRNLAEKYDNVPDIRLVAFDLDGVLVTEGSSWGSLHEHFGTAEKAKKNFAAYGRGEISYGEFMKRDIALWPKGVHADEIELLLSNFTLSDGAKETVAGLKKKGYEVAIISSGVDILANKVAKELGISHVLANGLEFDGTGRLTGRGIERVPLGRKEGALESLARYLELEPKLCAAVGDSVWDAGFLASSGFGVVYGSGGGEGVDKVAKLKIEKLAELLGYF